MKLVIDIPDEIYNDVKKYNYFDTLVTRLNVKEMIKNGVPLPKGHGAIIDVKDIETIRIVYNGELTIYKLGTGVEAYIYATPLVKPDEEISNEKNDC